ncbi:MAG: hypothetical protein V7752_22175 [Halopseudomonas sp.]
MLRNTVQKGRRGFSNLLLLSLSLLLSACGTPGLEELERLCKEEAGELIGEPIEVEGFFHASEDDCGGCMTMMTASAYQYIEWYNTKINRSMGDLDLNQHYRMYKAEKDNALCNWRIINSKDDSDYNFCIVTEAVNVADLLSKYSYSLFFNRKKLSKNVLLSNAYEEIKDMRAGEIVAYRNNYSLYPQKNSAFDPGKSISCSTDSNRFSKVSMPRGVLQGGK